MLVEACLRGSRYFAAADRLVNDSNACTSAHALLEAFATLSGDARLKISPSDAAQMLQDIRRTLSVHTAELADYQAVISEASSKGVRGGLVYDSLHAQVARRIGCEEIRTLNEEHFKLVAPDLDVVSLVERRGRHVIQRQGADR